MRITNTMMINNMMNNISYNLTRMNKLQDQMSTGKKISVPSDDPVIAARSLKLRTDVSEIEQYQRNVKDAQSWMEITESTLANVGDVLQRARELAVQGANSSNTTDDKQKIAEEVKQLKNQMIHLANTTYAGRSIFSGFKTDSKLIEESSGEFLIDVDNGQAIKYEIGIGDDININVPGGDLFNTDGADAVKDTKPGMIEDFDNYLQALNSGDKAGIENAIADMQKNIENVLRVRADVGARMNRLELTENRLDTDNINFTKLMSINEDVDMAETIMNLKNEENVYRASLSGGARIIQPTLVDFLK